MAAGTHNIVIEQAATFVLPLLWKDADGDPIPLTGAVARMQIRAAYGAATALITLTSAPGGGIVLVDPGQITITITDEQTDVLVNRSAVYDLRLDWPDGTSTRLIGGKVTIKPAATLDA